MSHEVIAYLTPDEQAGDQEPGNGRLQALVRLEDGSVALQDVEEDAETHGENATRFQQKVPIKDPQTNEVIGYEMEPVRRTS